MTDITAISATAPPRSIVARSRARRGPVARATRAAGRDLAYLTGVLGTSILGFVVWTVGVSLALSLSVLVIGVLVWVAVAGGLRITVDLDRRLVGWYREASLNGRYRHQVGGSHTARIKTTLTDPRVWADLRWLVLNSLFGFAAATVALAVTVEVVSLVAMPLWWWAISDPHRQYATLNLGIYTVTSTGWALVTAALGLALAPIALAINRSLAKVHSRVAQRYLV
ncbi:MAG: sensor domain-containing protein [Solirubrobacteraceae bacterium]